MHATHNTQVQYSLLDRRPANGMVEFAAAHGMSLLPYGVVGGGFLSDRFLGVPVNAVDVNTYSKARHSYRESDRAIPCICARRRRQHSAFAHALRSCSCA